MDNEITEKYPLHEYEFELTEEDVKLFKEQAYIRTVNLIDSLNQDKNIYRIITQGVKLNPNVLSTYNGVKTENKLYLMMLTDSNVKLLSTLSNVVSVEKPELLSNQKGAIMFPKGNNYNWTTDNYGPIYIPKSGATIALTDRNLELYGDIIEDYEVERRRHIHQWYFKYRLHL